MSLDKYRRLTLSLYLFITLVSIQVEAGQILQAPGELINVGGHRLHINCQGQQQSKPTVMIDSGLGGFSLEWQGLQDNLSKHYRICSYDRAGYGWSDPGPFPRTTKTIIAELRILMQQAKLIPPYVLVGHSFGGYNMMYFSKAFPNEVSGLILIDSSHPEQAHWFPTVFPELPNGLRRTRYISIPKLPANYPYEYRNIAYHLMSARKARNALRFESMNFEISGRQVKSLGNFPNIPLVVLTRGERAWPQSSKGDELETSWVRLQNKLTRMSKRSVHIMANYSGHFIHLDQPSLVEQAIKSVIELPCNSSEAEKRYVELDENVGNGEC